MDSSLKLFLIGLVIGLSAIFFERMGDDNLWDNPGKFFLKLVSASATVWIFIFTMMIIVTLPVISINPLKKRFTPKQFLPFPLMAGCSFGFLSLQIVAMIFNR